MSFLSIQDSAVFIIASAVSWLSWLLWFCNRLPCVENQLQFVGVGSITLVHLVLLLWVLTHFIEDILQLVYGYATTTASGIFAGLATLSVTFFTATSVMWAGPLALVALMHSWKCQSAADRERRRVMTIWSGGTAIICLLQVCSAAPAWFWWRMDDLTEISPIRSCQCNFWEPIWLWISFLTSGMGCVACSLLSVKLLLSYA